MQTAAAPGHIEIGLESRQIPQGRELRDRGARRRIGDQIEMLAGLANLLNRYRDMPGRGGVW